MKESPHPYRPANATEGTSFDDNWCSRCERDLAWSCDILHRVLTYDIGEPQYPTELVEDPRPRCTAFLPVGGDPLIMWRRRPGRWGLLTTQRQGGE